MKRDFRKIKAWQLADRFVLAVYDALRNYPKQEQYGLTQQTRRAAVSVPSNIAEGASRRSQTEYLRFCDIACGSLAEARYQLHLARQLGYLDIGSYEVLEALADELSAVLHGLMEAIQRET